MADSAGQQATQDAVANSTGQDSEGIEKYKEMFRKAKAVRDKFIPDWYLNYAFYLGQQWLMWNRGRLDMPRLADWRVTLVDNRIQPVVLSRCARKVKNRPAFVSTPMTADEADIDAAKIGEKVLDYDWNELTLQHKLFGALLFAEICCAGFWKIYWDSTKGKSAEFVIGQDGNPLPGANGAPMRVDQLPDGAPPGAQTQTLALGDVCVEVISPFEFFPDPLAQSLEDAEWVIEEKVRSKEYVKKRYDKDIPEDAEAPGGPVESRLMGSLVFAGPGSGDGTYKGIKVYELWMRPCSDYPNGMKCVWAGDQILEQDENPFDPMPYVMFSGTKVPNRFWPTSLVTQLRGPQMELNKIRSQIQENANRIGNPALMKSRQANVHYTGVPGEEVLYDSTVSDAVPRYLQPPEVPMYVREEVERIEKSFEEISGMHEVSRATVPQGVTAASAINLLQEADDTRLGPEIQDMEKVLSDAGSKILRLRAQFNTDERLIRIAGEDGAWDIFGFRGAMLNDNTNVEVQAGSAMPRSKAAKQAAMIEILQTAFQYGVHFDPRDLRRFFKDYEVAALDRLFDSITEDEVQIQREHRLMMQGTAVNINEWDNDQAHIDGHNELRKSERFATLPAPIQEIINTHVRAHQERAVQAINMQMQAMAGQNGGGPAVPPQPELTTPDGGHAGLGMPNAIQ